MAGAAAGSVAGAGAAAAARAAARAAPRPRAPKRPHERRRAPAVSATVGDGNWSWTVFFASLHPFTPALSRMRRRVGVLGQVRRLEDSFGCVSIPLTSGLLRRTRRGGPSAFSFLFGFSSTIGAVRALLGPETQSRRSGWGERKRAGSDGIDGRARAPRLRKHKQSNGYTDEARRWVARGREGGRE